MSQGFHGNFRGFNGVQRDFIGIQWDEFMIIQWDFVLRHDRPTYYSSMCLTMWYTYNLPFLVIFTLKTMINVWIFLGKNRGDS